MSLVTLPRQLTVDANGTPRTGAKLYVYQAGTTTPITAYTTSAYAVAHASPILSNTAGLFPAVYVDPSVNTTYKILIKDFDEVEIYSEDVIPALPMNQSDIGRTLYPRTQAEGTAAVTPTDYSNQPLPIIDARRYGYSVSASGAANTTAINNASLVAVQMGGGTVQLPPGAAVLNGRIDGYANVYVRGHGPNSTKLTQQHVSDEVYLAVDTSYCGLHDLRVVPNSGDGIVWRASAGDPLYFQLRNVFVQGVAANKSGVWLDATGGHVLYWPHLDSLYVQGGTYANRTCLRIGNNSGTYPVVGTTIVGGRLFNAGKLIHLERAETLSGFKVSLDDAQGGTGIGVHFQNAASCEFYGMRVEPSTFDVMLQFDAASADNLIFSKHLGGVLSADIVDNGTRNEVYGSDGSGGFINSLKLPLNLPDVRSLSLSAAAGSTAATWHKMMTHTFNPASILANATQETAVSVTGVLSTDSVFVSPNGGLETGLTVCGAASADAVRIILANVTGSPIDPASRTFNIDIWRH